MKLKILLDIPPWEWPRDAGKTFRKTLLDGRADPADRLIAAELAGDTVAINDDLADVLLTIVRNPGEPEELRAKAATSFGPALEMAFTEFDEALSGFDDPDCVPITEDMFHTIQESLQKLYMDTSTPKLVRRRILEASVRDPEPWHEDLIREAFASGDREWMLTAVFAMQWVRGFEDEVLAQLESADEKIHFEAVVAAGNKELDAAWPHVAAIVKDARTPKDLLIAAIGAAGSIRPAEAGVLLVDLADSDDEDIAEAADEAMMMAELVPDDEEDEESE
jgi:hypothetical protein